jgi:hypothetical protein
MELKRKKDLTSSISSIKGAAIQNLVTPSFESQLAGRASGVHYKRYWNLGEAPKSEFVSWLPYFWNRSFVYCRWCANLREQWFLH